jgi:hypothetical protein
VGHSGFAKIEMKNSTLPSDHHTNYTNYTSP